MTELNEAHHHEAAQPSPEWPGSPAPATSEPSIAALMATIDGVKELPVSEHEAVYSDLHDALLQALNEEPRNGEGEA
ncbi:UNVERIFIED_ORG: putative spore protein YtfJ [Arthrobacter sp. UYCu721]